MPVTSKPVKAVTWL